jgi:hypothetical protein
MVVSVSFLLLYMFIVLVSDDGRVRVTAHTTPSGRQRMPILTVYTYPFRNRITRRSSAREARHARDKDLTKIN